MKKFFPVIIGLCIGIIASGVMISSHGKNIAYGVGNTWSTYNFFEWNEIFTPSSKGKNLYNLVYNKRLIAPERDALKEVAKQNGLTQKEAQQAIKGSVSIVLNGPAAQSTNFNQSDAVKTLQGLQDDFDFLSSVFELEQEIDLSVAPTEIFANGDIFDSGFDLVHDLDIIEEILFVQKTKTTVGAPFDGMLDSPYLADAEDGSPYIENQNPISIISFENSQSSDSPRSTASKQSALEFNENGSVNLPVGDSSVPVNILDEDICEPGDAGYNELLSQLPQSSQSGSGGSGINQSDNVSGVDDLALDNAASDELALDADNPGISRNIENGKVLAATPGDWEKVWCEGGGGYSDGAENSDSGSSVHASFCLELQLRKTRVASYNPGDGCVACEIEKINQLLDKTLSHSLIPNKVTGNLMESAKCKDGYSAGLDMQFIAIANPIPTPPNDEIIGDPNIIEEWNSFADAFIPFVDPDDAVSDFEIKYKKTGASQDEIYANIIKQQNADRSAASFDVATAEVKAEFANTLIYSQAILREIKQMNNYFKNFRRTFADVDQNACKAIVKKKTLD